MFANIAAGKFRRVKQTSPRPHIYVSPESKDWQWRGGWTVPVAEWRTVVRFCVRMDAQR